MSKHYREKEISYEDSWKISFGETLGGKILLSILRVIIEIIT